MTEIETLALCIEQGWLIPVQVFGTDQCCEHGEYAECLSTGYGLCDRFSKHSPAGSDCNRADNFLLRPSDAALRNPRVQAAFAQILEGF